MFILRETKNWSIPYILDQDISVQQEDPIGVWRFSPSEAIWNFSVLKCIDMQKEIFLPSVRPFFHSA